jgi:acetylornithine deacetylase/succinyl-diaminopimelate desuccinylase-like protein
VPSDAKGDTVLLFDDIIAADSVRKKNRYHFALHTPDGVLSRIEWEGEGVAPCLVPIDTPAYQVLTEAISAAFDGLPVLPTREGGSGPEAAIAQCLGVPMVFLGVGLPDDQIHAPNEKVNLSMLYRGAEAAALLWAGYARLGRAGLGTRR